MKDCLDAARMPDRYYSYVKRTFDICLSGTALLLFMPILLAVALAIRLKLGSPIFFRQQRPGLNAKPFYVIKFRTMLDAYDDDGAFLSDEERLTTFGKFLRSTSLDELPELWNVLKGEMSLVGPRPLLMQYLPLYSPAQARRHDVRPGITGWAQVNGRNALDWDEKFKLDIYYLDNQSLWLDFKILAMTVQSVFARSGISNEGHVTMPPFTGKGRQ